MTSYKSLLLVTALLCLTYSHPIVEHCNHDDIEQDPALLEIEEDLSVFTDERRLAGLSNMRVHVLYDFLSSAPSAYASYIKNELIPPIADYFEGALRVKAPVVGLLKLGTSVGSICEHKVPASLRAGVPADFVIYYDTNAVSGTVLASTKYCYLASGTKRPLIARTIINRNQLEIAKGNVILHEKNMYVMMHEFMHGLGFSDSCFKNFIDNNGNTLKNHIKKAKLGGITRTVIDVAPLTQKLRNYFGCPSLPGAVMENGGGDGTSASHFERRYFVYETMASGSILGRRVSELSLGLLEGSGWYAPDYDFAEPYFYGQGEGCPFVTDSCSTANNAFTELCNTGSRGCAPHGRGGGSCGSDSISDGCKYYGPDVDYDCENDDGEDYARLPDLQVFGRGSGSRCFAGTLNTRKSSGGRTSFCFRYTCSGSGSNTELEIQVGNNKVACTREGSKTLDGYYGDIECPDPLRFCNTIGKKYCPRNCMNRGTCVNNKCQCKSGYTGVDCALRV